MVEGLAERFDLSVIARRMAGGVEISWPAPAEVRVTVGPQSRAAFARFVASRLFRDSALFDAVLVQGYGLAALAANTASRITGRPTVMLVCSPVERYYLCRRYNKDSRKPFRGWEHRALGLLARTNARIGRQYVVLSDHLQELVHAHGASRGRVQVIPVYGVDTNVFKPADAPKAAIRQKLGLPVTEPLIFFSSRIAPEKDAATLLEAVSQMAKTGVRLRLLHLSGGFEEFLALAAERGLADRVIARNAVHPHRELPLYYQASDLCIQASHEEGLGFSPLEALACEVPVIASPVGGLRETVVPRRTGWTYTAGDPGALERAIREVLDRPEQARQRAKAGRQMVIERYDRKKVFDHLTATLGS